MLPAIAFLAVATAMALPLLILAAFASVVEQPESRALIREA